jgi:SAM-dependent methyltransferase
VSKAKQFYKYRPDSGAIIDPTMSDYSAFGMMERDGWSDPSRASGYVKLFASASDQSIPKLLAAVDAKENLKALDLCCGQGNVAEVLVDRGCDVVGVDFSPVMLALARQRVPGATFFEADAQDLPFSDAEFDIVVSNFGICHVPDQPRALLEIRRVLRPQGRFAMTVWCGPDVSPCFEVVYGAVKAHGNPNVSLPPGPDFHQFAKREIAETLLSKAGFSNIELSTVDCGWDVSAPENLAEIIERGTVRAAMLLANQPPQNLAAIRSAPACDRLGSSPTQSYLQAMSDHLAGSPEWLRRNIQNLKDFSFTSLQYR